MSILAFTLRGDIAFWRDFEDSVGNLTCLGPAPSHILGIIAACFGWSSTNRPHNQKGQAPWPYAAQLKTWVETNKPKVAARLLSVPVRIPLSVNGFKNAQTLEYTRIQQTVLENPAYQVALSLESEKELSNLESALMAPAFRVCMGSQFCPAFIRDVTRLSPDANGRWAFFTPAIGPDSTPLTIMELCDPKNRIHKSGYWNYLAQEETLVEQALLNAFHGP
jgi:CRISPR-associated Cas5-like protein